jgi:hypothetical protein
MTTLKTLQLTVLFQNSGYCSCLLKINPNTKKFEIKNQIFKSKNSLTFFKVFQSEFYPKLLFQN